MNRLLKYALLGFALIAASGMQAQQIPVFNQYVFNPYLYNPARAGQRQLGNLYIGQKRQWTDIPDAPDTKIMTFDMPLRGTKSGVGVTLFSDNTHIIRKIGGSVSYAYHILIDEAGEHSFSMGLSGGFLSQNIDFSRATVQNPNDDAILGRDASATTFDVGFGGHYRYKRLNIDVSVPQLSNSNVRYLSSQGSISSFELISHYLGSARYEIPISKANELSIEPVMMVRGAKGLPVQYEASLLMAWYDRLWGGLGYRSGGNNYFTSSLNASVGFRVQKAFSISYTYDMMARGMDRTSLGPSHEFSLGFRFGGNGSKLDALEEKIRNLEGNLVAPDSLGPLTEGGARPGTATPATGTPPSDQAEMLRNLELLRQLKQLEDLQRLQDLQKLQQLQKLRDLQLLQEQQMLRELDGTRQPESIKGQIRDLYRSDTVYVDGDGTRIRSRLRFEKTGSAYFAYNSYELSEDAKAELRRVKERLDAKANIVTIYIAGNASIEGEATYNLVLSNRRAVAVKNYLASIGLNESVVLPIPYGAENPITREQVLETDREKNRRVDIYILAE